MAASGEVVVLLSAWVVSTTLHFVVVIADERRLDPSRLARAWPRTSRDAALVVFGAYAVPVHFARTRGHFGSARGALGVLLGAALGLVVEALVLAVTSAVVTLLAEALGIPA